MLQGIDPLVIAVNLEDLKRLEKAATVCAACQGIDSCALGTSGMRPRLAQSPGFVRVVAEACEFRKGHDTMQISMRKSSAGKRFMDRTFANFENRRGTEDALRVALEIAEDERAAGAIFSGPPGGGKSHLAAAIQHRNAERGVVTIFHDTTALFGILRSGSRGDGEEYENAVRECINAKVLILDDIDKVSAGSRDGALSPFAQEAIFRIINGRYERDGQTVVTCNSDLTQIERRLGDVGPAIVSRLLEMCRYVVVNATDYRQEHAGGARNAQ